MRSVRRCLPWFAAAALVLAPCLCTAQVRWVQHAHVEVDGQASDMAPVGLLLNSYLVPLDKALAALTHGAATLDTSEPSFARVMVGGQMLARLPSTEEAGSFADVADPANPAALHKVRLYDPPRSVKGPDGQERLLIGLESLAGFLGDALVVDGSNLELFTPEYWCKQVGLNAAATTGRTVKNLAFLPDFGISPPAKTLLLWVRPPREGWVQIYTISDGAARPLFGINAFGEQVTHPRPTDTPASRQAEAGAPVRAETSFFGIQGRQSGSYVAVVTRDKPAGPDLIDAINRGDIKDDAFCVVGLRQTVVRSPIRYEAVSLKEGQKPGDVAAAYKMPPDLLLKLNGLDEKDRVAAGTRLVVVAGLDEGEVERLKQVDYEVTGLYEVQPGDTPADLARRWGVTTADFMDANPGVPDGSDLETGEIVNIVRSKARPPRPNAPPVQYAIKPMHALGQVKMPAEIREGSAPGSRVVRRVRPSEFVLILGKVVGRNEFRVSVGDTVGYMAEPTMLVKNIQENPGPAVSTGPYALAARDALQYIGTPYVWGGNNLRQGIDCSHFVAAAYAKAGLACPSPPVHTMERYGSMVHWKQGLAEEFDKTVSMASPPDLSALRPGDRIIMQNDPTRRYDGNHHTGIYLGRIKDPRFGNLQHAIVHASSRKGVWVTDLVNSYLWKKYRYAVRGDRLRSADAGPAKPVAHAGGARGIVR